MKAGIWKIKSVFKGRIVRGLILAISALYLMSCSGPVDFGFPWTSTSGATSLVKITPPNPSIPMGATQQFTATATQANGTSTDVSAQSAWISSNASVATVDNRGLAKALQPGTATITATSGGTSGSTTLTVTPSTLSLISLSPFNTTVPEGFARQLTATGIFSDGTTFDISKQVTWSSSDDTVAKVDPTGLVLGIGPGTVTIFAASGALSGNTPITVTFVTLSSISLTPANPSIPSTPPGITQQLTATGTFSDGSTLDLSSQVIWNSSNLTAVTVNRNGLATAVAFGFSVITATHQTISGSTNFTVTGTALTSLSVTPANPTIAQGATQQLKAVGTYADGTSLDISSQVTWRSDNISVATVSTTGLAIAVFPGTATVTAASGNIFASVTLTVTP